MQEVEWARMTAPELRAIAGRKNATAILPAGSLEQHGPHLAVITDTASASAVAIEGARRVEGKLPVAVLPGLWLGMSEHHLPFGGTISVDYQGYYGVLRGIVRSLRAVGFSRLFVVNGHGGNIEPLAVATRELSVEFAMPIAATTPWMSAAKQLEPVFERDSCALHACEGESSLMLHIAGDIVKADRFDEAMQQRPEPVNPPPGYSRFYSMAERAPITGTMGDPRVATAKKGEQFLAIMGQAVADALLDEKLWSPPDPVWRESRGQGPTANRDN